MTVPGVWKGNTKKKTKYNRPGKEDQIGYKFCPIQAMSKPKRNAAISSLLSLAYSKLQAEQS